jgi:rhodanese-related sulfurtransferase
LLDQLLADSRLYRTGKDYRALLDFVIRLRNFAPFNAMLLQVQKPGLMYAASRLDWLERFNRTVKDGARPLLILWPFGPVYASVGVDGSRPIITYCRIGERSSHTWFALSKILGYSVKNYDGSWTEYGNAVGVPISNPAGTIWAAK